MRTIVNFMGLLVVAFWLFVAVSWCVNLYKLTQCDFEPSYKAEILHVAGLIPVVSLVTAWADFGK